MRASLAVVAVLLTAAPAATAADSHRIGWGKIGVTFEQYRADAVSCGRKGYYRDVSRTDAARVLRDATRQLDTITDTREVQTGRWAAAEADPSQGVALMRSEEAPVHYVDVGQRMAQLVANTRPEMRMREVGRLLQSTVDACLVSRGYRRFQFTAAQQRHLGTLRHGTAERQAYLYGLATDARILEAQAVE